MNLYDLLGLLAVLILFGFIVWVCAYAPLQPKDKPPVERPLWEYKKEPKE